MSPCAPPSDLAFPTLLILAATKVAGQNCEGGNLCRVPPSAPLLDLSPTQRYPHVSFVFIFSWPTQLLATALKLFIHVRMQMTDNKQTNLKEIYEDELFKALISVFFQKSVSRYGPTAEKQDLSRVLKSTCTDGTSGMPKVDSGPVTAPSKLICLSPTSLPSSQPFQTSAVLFYSVIWLLPCIPTKILSFLLFIQTLFILTALVQDQHLFK